MPKARKDDYARHFNGLHVGVYDMRPHNFPARDNAVLFRERMPEANS